MILKYSPLKNVFMEGAAELLRRSSPLFLNLDSQSSLQKQTPHFRVCFGCLRRQFPDFAWKS